MDHLTDLCASEYLRSDLTSIPLTVSNPETELARIFRDRVSSFVGPSTQYGFDSPDHKRQAVGNLCAMLEFDFFLPSGLVNFEATKELAEDLANMKALLKISGKDLDSYRWNDAIKTKFSGARFHANGQGNDTLHLSDSFSTSNKDWLRSLSPLHLSHWNRSYRDTHLCYIPDLENQLQSLFKGETPTYDSDTPLSRGPLSQKFAADLWKHPISRPPYPKCFAIDQHIYVTDDPAEFGKITSEVLDDPNARLGRFWLNLRDKTMHEITPLTGSSSKEAYSGLAGILS